jgi:ATP-dependent Lhr-like helicase
MYKRMGLTVVSQHGNVAFRDRWKFSGDGELPNSLLTTPESLEILFRNTDFQDVFSSIRFVVINEIHASMETDRGEYLLCLLDRLELITTERGAVQRIGLSASIGNPENLLTW